MKKIIALILCVSLVLGIAACSNSDKKVLYVYNWGNFIADGVLDQFEEETGIKVVYEEFDDNENMYTKVKTAGDMYDIVVPSDYMVKKMIDEDMLAPINLENIPNFSNLDEQYTNMIFDEGNKYSVPYFVGTVGILYNKDLTGKEITKMSDMFDTKYSGEICMLYSMRDTIGMTMKMLGYSMNDINPDHINHAKDVLIEQKPHVLAYGADDIPRKVIDGTAAMALVYSGEGIKASMEQPENVRFVIPEEGSNIAIDNFVILKDSKHKEEAEMFINFMLREDIAYKNAMETGYTTPNKVAKEKLPDEIKNDTNRYPTEDILSKCEIFHSSNKHYVDAWDLILAAN